MIKLPFDAADLSLLAQWDTPTICNALELIVPERRAIGFTVGNMVALHPTAAPIIGLARTGTIRAKEPPRGQVAKRIEWYEYVGSAAIPTVVVLQDLDDQPGFGAFWGEVNTNLHRKLGALGCVTNGSFRDLSASAKDFQVIGGRVGPSHAHIHVIDFGGPVNIFGMQAANDDVIHADVHGAVVIPAECIKKLPEMIDLVARREKVILDLCATNEFSLEVLRAGLLSITEIH